MSEAVMWSRPSLAMKTATTTKTSSTTKKRKRMMKGIFVSEEEEKADFEIEATAKGEGES
jgi:hypothetical protein